MRTLTGAAPFARTSFFIRHWTTKSGVTDTIGFQEPIGGLRPVLAQGLPHTLPCPRMSFGPPAGRLHGETPLAGDVPPFARARGPTACTRKPYVRRRQSFVCLTVIGERLGVSLWRRGERVLATPQPVPSSHKSKSIRGSIEWVPETVGRFGRKSLGLVR